MKKVYVVVIDEDKKVTVRFAGGADTVKKFMERYDFNAGSPSQFCFSGDFLGGLGGHFDSYEEFFQYLSDTTGPFHKKMKNITVMMADENYNWMYATGREDIQAMNFAYVHEPLPKRIVKLDETGYAVYDSLRDSGKPEPQESQELSDIE